MGENHQMMPVSAAAAGPLAAWLVRGLLGAALLFGGEVLLWNDPPGRALWQWGVLVLGYLALAALVLDVFVRYRVHDFWGVMTLAGVCGLGIGVLLNPQSGLADVPRTLVTRVTGAYTLLSLEMLVLFLALTGGQMRSLRWSLMLGSAAVGLAWGTYTRFAPSQTDVAFGDVPLQTLLLFGAGGVGVIMGIFALAQRRASALMPDGLLLGRREWGVLLSGLAALVLLRVLQGDIRLTNLLLAGILFALCWGILWYRRSTKKPTLLYAHLPIRPLSLVWVSLAVAILFWTGVFAYSLPQIGSAALNQLSVVVFGFALYGLAWLPTVSLVLGARAYIRQIQGVKI